MKVTPLSKAGSLVSAAPNTPANPRVIKMSTNTRSAGQQWMKNHPPQAAPSAPGANEVRPTAANNPINSTPLAPQTAQNISNAEAQSAPAAEVTSPALSPQFASLARLQKQFRKAQQEFKAQQEAWKQEQANYISRKQLETDPLKTLTEAGLSYDRLTELQLNQANPDPNQALLDKIASLESRLASVDEQFNNRDKQAYDQAVATIRRDAELLVNSDPTYETIRETRSTGDVVKLIQAVFEDEGDILSVEEAAQLVEDQLVERKVDEYNRLTKLAKISKRLAPTQSAQASAQASAPLEQGTSAPKQVSKTLTNSQGSTRALTPVERAIEKYKAGMGGR